MELVLTLIADDRPGIVDQVATALASHHGNWAESRMAILGGKFAGIARVAVPDQSVAEFTADVTSLPDVTVTVTASGVSQPITQTHTLSVVANDRSGILAEVSRALAAIAVNVVEVDTAVEPASMSGGVLFRALIQIALTADQALGDVIAVLEDLSEDLMIDVLSAAD